MVYLPVLLELPQNICPLAISQFHFLFNHSQNKPNFVVQFLLFHCQFVDQMLFAFSIIFNADVEKFFENLNGVSVFVDFPCGWGLFFGCVRVRLFQVVENSQPFWSNRTALLIVVFEAIFKTFSNVPDCSSSCNLPSRNSYFYKKKN